MPNTNAAPLPGVVPIHDAAQNLVAIIVRAKFNTPGVNFLTPQDSSQQIGCLIHPAGKVIQPHVHKPVSRHIQNTQEVLFVRAGKVRVDFYSDNKNYLGSDTLFPGDTVLLIKGGHGFETLEPTDMIEVKQGPYVEGQDKTLFAPVSASELRSLPNSSGAK